MTGGRTRHGAVSRRANGLTGATGMAGHSGDMPRIERKEREGDVRKKKAGVFWSINFMKHTDRISSVMFLESSRIVVV